MKLILRLKVLIVATILAARTDALSADVRLAPFYIEQTNGLYAVCALESRSNSILQYKGFEITPKDVPTPSPYHAVGVYRLGERPAETNSWKPSSTAFYMYGRPTYPINEVDPPFEASLDSRGVLLVGFHLRGRFYAVTNIVNPQLKSGMTTQYWSRVIMVDVPSHRKEEMSRYLNSVLSNDQDLVLPDIQRNDPSALD